MTTSDDEFADLAAEAAEFGIELTSVPHVRREAIDVGHGRVVSALRWGEGAPRVVFLHGAGLNAHTWNATVLAGGWPAVALDLPGHGDSSWRADADYRPATIADAVADALDHWAPEADVLVGQSLGGLTAAAVAARRPDLVRRLVLVDITPGLVVGGGNQVRDFLAGPTRFRTRADVVDRALAFGFGPTRRAVERGVLRNTRIADDGWVEFKHHLANLGERTAPFDSDFTSLWPPLETFAGPSLLVRGGSGFIDGAAGDEFLRRVPGSHAAVIDSGHNVQEEAPVQLANALAAFLHQQGPGADLGT